MKKMQFKSEALCITPNLFEWILGLLSRGNHSCKIGVTEINKILLNSTPNSWYKQAYVQGFDCESILFKGSVNMFEFMETAESIYEGVVTPSYKKTTRAESKHTGLSKKKERRICIIKYPPRNSWECWQEP